MFMLHEKEKYMREWERKKDEKEKEREREDEGEKKVTQEEGIM